MAKSSEMKERITQPNDIIGLDGLDGALETHGFQLKMDRLFSSPPNSFCIKKVKMKRISNYLTFAFRQMSPLAKKVENALSAAFLTLSPYFA
jgi:hypothetical protein